MDFGLSKYMIQLYVLICTFYNRLTYTNYQWIFMISREYFEQLHKYYGPKATFPTYYQQLINHFDWITLIIYMSVIIIIEDQGVQHPLIQPTWRLVYGLLVYILSEPNWAIIFVVYTVKRIQQIHHFQHWLKTSLQIEMFAYRTWHF